MIEDFTSGLKLFIKGDNNFVICLQPSGSGTSLPDFSGSGTSLPDLVVSGNSRNGSGFFSALLILIIYLF